MFLLYPTLRAVCYQQLKLTKLALRDYGIVLMLEKEANQKVSQKQ